MDKLGLVELRQQLIYIDAYQQGYDRWLLTNSCVPKPYNQGLLKQFFLRNRGPTPNLGLGGKAFSF